MELECQMHVLHRILNIMNVVVHLNLPQKKQNHFFHLLLEQQFLLFVTRSDLMAFTPKLIHMETRLNGNQYEPKTYHLMTAIFMPFHFQIIIFSFYSVKWRAIFFHLLFIVLLSVSLSPRRSPFAATFWSWL